MVGGVVLGCGPTLPWIGGAASTASSGCFATFSATRSISWCPPPVSGWLAPKVGGGSQLPVRSSAWVGGIIEVDVQ